MDFKVQLHPFLLHPALLSLGEPHGPTSTGGRRLPLHTACDNPISAKPRGQGITVAMVDSQIRIYFAKITGIEVAPQPHIMKPAWLQ